VKSAMEIDDSPSQLLSLLQGRGNAKKHQVENQIKLLGVKVIAFHFDHLCQDWDRNPHLL